MSKIERIEISMYRFYCERMVKFKSKQADKTLVEIANELKEDFENQAENVFRDSVFLAGNTDSSLKDALLEIGYKYIENYIEETKE